MPLLWEGEMSHWNDTAVWVVGSMVRRLGVVPIYLEYCVSREIKRMELTLML